MSIKIVIADDHEIFRKGLISIFADDLQVKIVGEAAEGGELLKIVERLKPGVVLMDMKMPGIDGVQATQMLNKDFPDVRVIALTMFSDDEIIIDMLQAGARGYLLKNATKSEIIEAIKSVSDGRTYYDRRSSEKLVSIITNSPRHNRSGEVQLSLREKEIIRLICLGHTNKEISLELNLSTRSVEGYREKIQEKIQAKNSIGIAIYAIRNNLFSI
jgi:DNA-binding NarL/FixJ family response regulator